MTPDDDDASESQLNTDVAEIYKRKIKQLDKELRYKRSSEEIIIKAMQEVWIDPPSLEIPSAPKLTSRTEAVEIAVGHLSDTQIGKTTKTYNTKIAAKRIAKFIEKAIHVTEVRRNSAKIDEFHLYLGGDMVEGEEIFGGQVHEIDSSVYEQAIVTGASIIVKAILRLLKSFNKVKVLTVPGNHGRNGKYGGGASLETNWDNVCYAAARYILMGSNDYPRQDLKNRLIWPESDTWFAVDKIFNWGNLIVHGDQITGGFAGFPWYGAGKKAQGWIDSIDEPWDYLYFGHFHTFASFVLNRRMVLANGTTESDNEYARSQLAASGFPCQRLAFYNAKYGLISDNQIFLADDRRPNRDKAIDWLAKD